MLSAWVRCCVLFSVCGVVLLIVVSVLFRIFGLLLVGIDISGCRLNVLWLLKMFRFVVLL